MIHGKASLSGHAESFWRSLGVVQVVLYNTVDKVSLRGRCNLFRLQRVAWVMGRLGLDLGFQCTKEGFEYTPGNGG